MTIPHHHSTSSFYTKSIIQNWTFKKKDHQEKIFFIFPLVSFSTFFKRYQLEEIHAHSSGTSDKCHGDAKTTISRYKYPNLSKIHLYISRCFAAWRGNTLVSTCTNTTPSVSHLPSHHFRPHQLLHTLETNSPRLGIYTYSGTPLPRYYRLH